MNFTLGHEELAKMTDGNEMGGTPEAISRPVMTRIYYVSESFNNTNILTIFFPPGVYNP